MTKIKELEKRIEELETKNKALEKQLAEMYKDYKRERQLGRLEITEKIKKRISIHADTYEEFESAEYSEANCKCLKAITKNIFRALRSCGIDVYKSCKAKPDTNDNDDFAGSFCNSLGNNSEEEISGILNKDKNSKDTAENFFKALRNCPAREVEHRGIMAFFE